LTIYRKLLVGVVAVSAIAGAWQALDAADAAPAPAAKNASKTDVAPVDHDPYLWLAKIHGKRAMDWVKAQNVKSDAVLKTDPNYAENRTTILAMLNAKGRIATPDVKGKWVYNFWQGPHHVRGVWRRTKIADYNSGHPHWNVLLDIDKLDAKTGRNWVWKGADCTKAFDRCLVRLSPGGGDAIVIREFDPKTGAFPKDGFRLPVAKSEAQYVNENTILFSSDFGPGSITPSSYPRIVKLWHRGQKLSQAQTVFEGRKTDMVAGPEVFHGPYGTVALIVRRPSFFRANYYSIAANGGTRKIDVPATAELQGVTAGQLIFTLRKSWKQKSGKVIPQGSLIALAAPGFEKMAGSSAPRVLYSPGKHEMIATEQGVQTGRDAVYAAIYKDVKGSVRAFRFQDGKWIGHKLDLPGKGSTQIVSANPWGSQAYVQYESFTQPPTLYFDGGDHHAKKIYALPARFDASKVSVVQHWVTSKDGTRVPYFLIRPKNAKGPIPTILYGYGGFNLSLTPWYWDDGHRPLDAGQVWIGKGGAIAVANIRGGGEFGPAWHQAALKYHRQRAYDDFEAVGADLVKHDWTTPKMMGIVGASNGGLLVTATMTQRPDLFAAVVCQRPLIDMLRYTHYGAGASWEAEYGDPADPRMAAYIRTYSPYQNVHIGKHYPPVLFITETSDDRVTPIWARMMAAKMEAQGHEVLFNEAAEGGHGPGATHAEAANYWALSYTFFQKKLGLK
jgi:prolyl oligopeptidase